MLLDPAQALIESKKLNTLASQCQGIINEMNLMIEELSVFWEGTSAEMFTYNNQQIIDSIKSIKSEMLQISKEIETLANIPV